MVKIAPTDKWAEPMLRLSGLRSLCRSDYVDVTPFERDRLIELGYAIDYVAPPAPAPAPAPVPPPEPKPSPPPDPMSDAQPDPNPDGDDPIADPAPANEQPEPRSHPKRRSPRRK